MCSIKINLYNKLNTLKIIFTYFKTSTDYITGPSLIVMYFSALVVANTTRRTFSHYYMYHFRH